MRSVARERLPSPLPPCILAPPRFPPGAFAGMNQDAGNARAPFPLARAFLVQRPPNPRHPCVKRAFTEP